MYVYMCCYLILKNEIWSVHVYRIYQKHEVNLEQIIDLKEGFYGKMTEEIGIYLL